MTRLSVARIAFCLFALLPAWLVAQGPQEQPDNNPTRRIPKRIAAQWSARVVAAMQQSETNDSDAAKSAAGRNRPAMTEQDVLNLLDGSQQLLPGDPESLLLDPSGNPADPLNDLLGPQDSGDPLDLLAPRRLPPTEETASGEDPHEGLWTETCYPLSGNLSQMSSFPI